ncbi:putative ribonuclease H-like domain-containing protein [Tanacetum coccineum]
MNKADIKITIIDDLYNNFKIVEQYVKKSVGASSGAQNMAFMTAPSTSSTNDVNTANPAYEVSTVSPNVNTACPQVSTANFSDNTVYAFMVENPKSSNLLQQDLEQIHEDDLEAMDLKWQLSLLSMRAKRYFQRTGKKICINANDTVRYDKSKVECFNCHKMGHFARECKAPRNKEGQFRYQDNTRKQGNNKNTSSNAMLAIDGVEFKAATYKRGLATVEEQLVTYRKYKVLFSEEVAVLNREVACKDYEINVLKSEFEKVKQEKEGYNDVPPPHPLIYNGPTKLDLSYSGLDEFKDPEFKSYGSKDKQLSEDTSSFVESLLNVDKETIFLVDKKIEFVKPKNHENPVKRSVRMDYDYYAKTTDPSVHRNMTPRAVLLKTGLTPLNTVRPINTAHPKPIVHSAKLMSHFFKQAQSTDQRPFYKKTALTSRYVNQKLNTAMRHYHTERLRAVNTARSYTAPVNAVKAKRVNVVKTSACWVWRPTRPNGASLVFKRHNYIDARGRSKHMTGNIACLSDFKEFDGGYVTFRGGAHGGRISSKGILKRIALILKIQILLKIPRNDNMYSFDMKNIVPKESLTCLVTNATLDESMLWHRRLGHINFKIIKSWEATQSFLEKGIKSGLQVHKENLMQVEDGPHNESDEKDKSEDDSSPKEVNATGQHVNTVSPKANIDSPKDMFKLGASHTLEATHVEFFNDEDEPEVDLGNNPNSNIVPTTPNTRIHKDHLIKNMIGDVKSSIQTRRMTKSTSEQGFLSAEELLQFKLQQVWKLVDLPNGKRAIGTKWECFFIWNLTEEVNVTQSPGFKDPDHLGKVYKVYVDDIIFGSTNKEMCTTFEKLIKDTFQMSSMGELTFFLGLQVTQKEYGIFISRDKYVAEIL